MKIIIPVHSSTKYVREFQKIFNYSNDLIFVFDRVEVPKNFKGNYKTYNGEEISFLAGKIRNIGIEDIDDDVLFFDEDKIPSENPIHKIEKLKNKYDCILYFSEYNDTRITKLISHNNDDFIPLKTFGDNNNFVYTCGIFLKKEVINDIKYINNGKLFHPIFDGKWGREDAFLGDEILALGYKIGYDKTIKLKNGVSSSNNRIKADEFNDNIKKELILRNVISDDFKAKRPYVPGLKLIKNLESTRNAIQIAYNTYKTYNELENWAPNVTKHYTCRKFPQFTLGFVNWNKSGSFANSIAIYYAIKSLKKLYQENIFNNILICQGETNPQYRLENLINLNDLIDGITIFNSRSLSDDKFLSYKKYPNLSHCYKIDELIKHTNSKYLILCDSDILFKKDITPLLNEIVKYNYDIITDIYEVSKNNYPTLKVNSRVVPMFLILKVDWALKNKFFNPDFLANNNFITGGNILNDIIFNYDLYDSTTIKKINIEKYITHFGGVSYLTENTESRSQLKCYNTTKDISYNNWININKDLIL